MPQVTFMPMNKTVEAKDDDTILDVAINEDIPIQHACGGFCSCTTCHVHVKEGGEFLSTMEEEEEDLITTADEYSQLISRLGCQARVKGNVTVEIINEE